MKKASISELKQCLEASQQPNEGFQSTQGYVQAIDPAPESRTKQTTYQELFGYINTIIPFHEDPLFYDGASDVDVSWNAVDASMLSAAGNIWDPLSFNAANHSGLFDNAFFNDLTLEHVDMAFNHPEVQCNATDTRPLPEGMTRTMDTADSLGAKGSTRGVQRGWSYNE